MLIHLGEVDLEVDLAQPVDVTRRNLVLAHPHPLMGGDMDNKVILQLHRRAKSRGWGSVRFNFRGVGSSTGLHDQGEGETKDLLALLDWLRTEKDWPMSRTILCGYSFGAWVSSRASISQADLGGLFLIAPPLKHATFPNLQETPFPKRIFAAAEDELVPLNLLESWASKLRAQEGVEIFEGADHFFVGQTVKLLDRIIGSIEELD